MVKYCTSQQGFTLAEIVISVAVMAILATMGAPALTTFLRQHDVHQEQVAQINIQNAMVSMLKEKYYLPDQAATGNAAWYIMLSRYTNLSPHDLQYDQWHNPRSYLNKLITLNFQGTAITVNYATLLSKGPSGIAQQVADLSGTIVVPVSGNNFAAITDTHWWNGSTQADIPTAFGAVGVPPNGTNIITRYTDYLDKINAAIATQNRMVKVAQAVDSYGRARYAERTAYCNSTSPTTLDCTTTNPPDQRIHIPMGYGIVVGDSSSLYNAAVLSATTLQNGGTGQPSYFSNVADNPTRKSNMVDLMRLIGVPDEYCCSSVDYYTDPSGNLQPQPFYYFSNPRIRTSTSTCGQRFNGTSATTLLPPRITNVYVPDASVGATCG